MPIGTNSFTCRDCGQTQLCGDCIPSLCRECFDLRVKARREGIEGRCRKCGNRLSTRGECFDCEVFGSNHGEQYR